MSIATLMTSCAADLPPSVVEGSSITVGWTEPLTSLNAASSSGDTEGNREIAAATHDTFARVAGGEVVVDDTFGEVSVIDPEAESFTVRYDLAERNWSDGIPIDAADLLLAWAAGSRATAGEFDSVTSELQSSTEVPELDEFKRRIDVSFAEPIRDWHTALDVAVPAHVAGEMALGLDDPMEAKQAVIDAITEGDEADLAAIAETWSSGFDVTDPGDLPDGLKVGSGAYLVSSVEAGEPASNVTLKVNRAYDGGMPPEYETIEVVASVDPLAEFPTDLDVVQLKATPENFVAVRNLERRDQHVSESHAGQLWTLVLRADKGLFSSVDARRAFLRASPPSDLRSGGSGDWEGAFSTSQSLLFPPESDGYEIVIEDAGFNAAFQSTTSDAEGERARAGVAAGTEVCVRYDTDEAFAAGAFLALQAAVADAGWVVRDCGAPGVEASPASGKGWQALLTKVALPDVPTDITTVWGGGRKSPLTGLKSKERKQLVSQLEQTADVYDSREVRVSIEAGLIQEAVALPLALEPVITLSERSMNPVLPDSGRTVSLLNGAAGWGRER